jgi:hypothetical protein|tara:strand:- start:2234 stop:2350 length:117 start_codon:yes stop_codon:yes gene_type:complete
MPQGPGTYGSKVGRPPKKGTKKTTAKKSTTKKSTKKSY